MNENTLPYLGIYKIDGIDYHAFYSTYESSSNVDRFFKFSAPIPKDIVNKRKFLTEYWKELWYSTIENILVISKPYSDSEEKFIFLGTNVKAQFYSSWTLSIDFNLMDMIVHSVKNSVFTQASTHYNTEEYKSLERKIKIASLLKETVI